MKPNLFIIFCFLLLFSVQTQIFQQLPGQIHEIFDRFEQINPGSEPPSQPNIQDLLSQAQNLVNGNNKNNKMGSFNQKMNILEPPKGFEGGLSFLAKNNDVDIKGKDAFGEKNEGSGKNQGVVIDGERYEYDELKEIIEFNKKLVKLCKIDFSNCFDIKTAILPKKKILKMLSPQEEKKEGKMEKSDLDDVIEKNFGGGGEIDQKIEDDLIDLGLK